MATIYPDDKGQISGPREGEVVRDVDLPPPMLPGYRTREDEERAEKVDRNGWPIHYTLPPKFPPAFDGED